MSTSDDKKTALLAKIARQKEKQKEQIYTIPTIVLSVSDQKRKAEKTFIPNTNLLEKKAKYEDQMREFMKEVNNLGDDEVISRSNIIVENGYKLFIDMYVKESFLDADDPTIDRNELKKDAKEEWLKLEKISKLIWVIKGYGVQKDAEWGRKQFTLEISKIIKSEDVMDNMIKKYLEGNIPYGKFVVYWKSIRGKDEIQANLLDEIAKGEAEHNISLENTRIDVTEDEQLQIDDLKEKLNGYEDAYLRLEKNSSIKTDLLSNLSDKKLIKLAIPIVSKNTKDELIQKILNVNTDPMPVFSEKIEYDDYIEKLEIKRAEEKSKLEERSFEKIVKKFTKKKTTSNLIKLLLYEEFYNNRKKITGKINKLSLQIKNLSLGKYIPRKASVKNLKYNERIYRDYMLVLIKNLELESMSYSKLLLYASSIDGIDYINLQKNNQTSKQVVKLILDKEFPNSEVDGIIPKVTYDEMKSVLLTFEEHKLYLLASSNGINNPENMGKVEIIEIILRKEFPTKKKKSIKHLVVGKYGKNWNYTKRQTELYKMETNDLKVVSLTLGLDLQKGVTNDQLIKQIMEQEQHISKLIPQEEKEKEEIIEKISHITGAPSSRYRLWSLDELQNQFNILKEESQEYWIEMEQGRLYKKLSQIIDINEPKYSQARQWNLKKLRMTLQKLAGSDWESYTPLIEDYSFVKCMDKYNQYNWIDGKVTGVWLSTVNGGIPKNEYIYKDIYIEEEGILWYQANSKFFSLQCNSYKKDRVQKDDILLSYTQAGKPIKLKVAYTVVGNKYSDKTRIVKTSDGRMVKRTFIIQDELLFRKENDFDRRTRQTDADRIQDILNTSVTERTANYSMKKLSDALLSIAPMKNDYGIIHIDSRGIKTVDYNTPYIQILMASLRQGQEQTNKELFTKVASLLVFINMPESKTFRKNIEQEYYLPDILSTLSPSEKFPEAFQDPNASVKFLDELTANINNKIYKLVRDMASSEYQSLDPTQSKRSNPFGVDFTRSVKTRKRIDACSNKDRVNGVSEQEIVYYKENDKIYCFTIDELYNQIIIQKDLTNPDTGKQFDNSFIDRFTQMYNKKLSSDGLLTEFFQKKYGFDMDELVKDKEKVDTIKYNQTIIALNLWDLISDDLGELENQLSNENPADDEEIDENREEERREAEVIQGTRESVEIDEKDACEYCKNHMADESIKSIILNGDESRIIKFCSFKCFENKNDWNKFKAKKPTNTDSSDELPLELSKEEKKKIKKIKKMKKTDSTNELPVELTKEEKKKMKKMKKTDSSNELPVELTKEEKKKIKKMINTDSSSSLPIKLSREEKKNRKTLINTKVTEEGPYFDKIALPLMNKTELAQLAKNNNIKIPSGLSKMDKAAFLYKVLHPKTTKGILKEKVAEQEISKIEKKKNK
jgi:hypothetical protein